MRLITGLMLAILVCPWAQAELMDDVNDRGELRIAVLADTPPYTVKQAQHLTGFGVELGQALASELDVRAAFLETPADQIVSGVESGKYDIALSQRQLEGLAEAGLDASQPYGEHALVIPFQKDNPAFENALNNALQRIQADGRLTALEQKWLSVPMQVTAGQ